MYHISIHRKNGGTPLKGSKKDSSKDHSALERFCLNCIICLLSGSVKSVEAFFGFNDTFSIISSNIVVNQAGYHGSSQSSGISDVMCYSNLGCPGQEVRITG